MEIQTFNSLESTFLSKFNEGHKTLDALRDNVPFSESILNNILELLISKNVIKFNTTTKEYEYDTPIEGDMVVLDGNIMLPTTIIRKGDSLIVTRGQWYSFPANFDVRTIIWNVQLPNKNKSTLADIVRESVLKVRKSRIVQAEGYKKLIGLCIPHSKNLILELNTIGDDLADVSLIFAQKIKISDEEELEFREFKVRSEIETNDLVTQLLGKVEDRRFQDIKINRIFNFSDFVFAGNCIPYNHNGTSIDYVKITGIKGKLELSYFTMTETGKHKRTNIESYLDASEGLIELKKLFDSYANGVLMDMDFLIES